MGSRPRRSAATKANEVISVHARWADSPERSERSERSMSSRRSGRASGVSISRDDASSPGGDRHLSLTVKLPSNKLRQATRGERGFEGGEIVSGKRNRGAKKSYVVDSSPDEDEEEEEEAEIEVEEDDDDEMDVDAEGEEDAEGDIDMDLAPPTITVSKPARSKPAPRASAAKVIQDDDDDDELSDPADSDAGDETMGFGDETMADDGDEDAEGEEIEVAGQEGDEDDEDEEDEEEDDEGDGGDDDDDDDDDDDEDGNPDESVDLTKMTKRQRARFEDDNAHQYMKLSDEVQAKKVFTAEELSMRRQEMARRRRNLSEKRNEEVKMETINKLLKKQAPKINRKAAAAGAGGLEDSNKPDPVFVRWVSNKTGVRVAVTEEMLDSPAGQVFKPASKLAPGKMVQEVA